MDSMRMNFLNYLGIGQIDNILVYYKHSIIYLQLILTYKIWENKKRKQTYMREFYGCTSTMIEKLSNTKPDCIFQAIYASFGNFESVKLLKACMQSSLRQLQRSFELWNGKNAGRPGLRKG
jgi:hypothetical protein